MHSCLFALAGWRCVAFEPQSSCIAHIRRISALNQFDELRAEQRLVGDRAAADVDFYVSPSTWFSSLGQASVERYEPARRIQVDMITLDAYCRGHGMSPTCVKIDVEGCELLVLRGARRLLEATTPDLVIEVSAEAKIREAVWNLLVPFGYRAYVLSGSRGDVVRSMPSMGAFVAAGAGTAHVDAVFTADRALCAQLEARPGDRS
jgi:FkbM family methyltransferase